MAVVCGLASGRARQRRWRPSAQRRGDMAIFDWPIVRPFSTTGQHSHARSHSRKIPRAELALRAEVYCLLCRSWKTVDCIYRIDGRLPVTMLGAVDAVDATSRVSVDAADVLMVSSLASTTRVEQRLLRRRPSTKPCTWGLSSNIDRRQAGMGFGPVLH